MKSQRILRLQALLAREISGLVQTRLKDPRIGMATVTGVDVSPDARNAKIFVSILGGDKQRRDTLAGLNRSLTFVRREISGMLRTKTVPRFEFVYDPAAACGERMENLFKEIASDTGLH